MFQERLNQHFIEILLTTSDGNTYTGGEILKKTELLTRALSCIGVAPNDTVGIYCRNEMHGLAAMIACMAFGANFTILDHNENIEDVQVKIVLSNIPHGLIISEEVLDSNILTLSPDTITIISKGWNYSVLEDSEKDYINKIFEVVDNIVGVNEVSEEGDFAILEHLDMVFKDEYCINFHNGISKGIYNASIIKHSAIYAGIENGLDKLYDTTNKALNDPIRGPVLFLEPFSSLYDIINGVLIPILNGTHVIIQAGNTLTDIEFALLSIPEAKLLYINTAKLEELLLHISSNIPSWLKYINIIYNWKVRKLFNELGNNVKHIVTHGKVKERQLLNAIHKDYTILYVMSEIASYIAKGTFKKIPKQIWLMPRSNMLLNTTGGNYAFGEINILTNDTCNRYLLETPLEKYFDYTIEQSYFKDVEGKLRTEDIGIIRNGKLLIKDKAKNIFVTEKGLVIETGRILALTKRFKVVKKAVVVSLYEKLILIVEIDINFLEVTNNKKDALNKMNQDLDSLLIVINKRVNAFSKIDRIMKVSDPEGFNKKNFKIVSKNF